MSGRNGERRPPRPRIEMLYPRRPAGSGREAEQPAGSDSEAAAIVAALEQFMADTSPAPGAAGPSQSPWQRAALEEGIAARQISGRGWGPAR